MDSNPLIVSTKRGSNADNLGESCFVFPMSFAQQRVWFIHQLGTGSAAYNYPVAFRLIGNLNVPALYHSLDNIFNRHESLRTTFAVVNHQPVQIIHTECDLKFSIVDFEEFLLGVLFF